MRRRSALGLAAGGLAAGLPLGLAGCGLSLPSWLGASNAKPPLPGVRTPVLLAEQGIRADPALADLKITLPPPVLNPAWPQSGGGPTHAPQHVKVADQIAEAWSADAGAGNGGRARLLAGPVMAGGRVFTVDVDGEVRAFAATDGTQIWSYDADQVEANDRNLGGGLGFADGRLVVTLPVGAVVALDAASGKEIWRQHVKAPLRTSPTIAGGQVLVPTADNQTFSLDARTGDLQWRHAGLFEQAGILGGASPAVDHGVVIAAYSSGEVYGLELSSGQPLWNETIVRPRRTLAVGTIPGIIADPVILNERVIVAGVTGEMASLDLARGDRLWSTDVTSSQMPWAAGDFIFALSEEQQLVCLTAQEGRVRWITAMQRYVDPADTGSRRIRWAGPVLASDRLLLASSEGEVTSVNPYTGKLLGTASLPGAVALPAAVAQGTVWYLTEGAELTALR